MSNHGSFSGNPKTEWLVDENGDDRNMALLEDFGISIPTEENGMLQREV